MNLKESYRYANYLDRLLDTALGYLKTKNFITTTKEQHLRSKANSEAEDEIIDVKKPYDVEFVPMNVIDFAVKVLTEKEKLVEAIATAKANTEINIDNAVAMNKKKQFLANTLNSMANTKPSETQTTGKSYKFDVNGEQKPYVYNIVSVTQIDFDRNDVRNLVKKYLKETDDISAKLDAIEINTQVNHECLFDMNSTFEELVMG